MTNRFACTALLCGALVGAGVPACAQVPAVENDGTGVPARARVQVAEYDGAAALGLALRRVGVTGRVLMIGAHPDDENTALLAALALERGLDVAYLSLTRGEGGQNGIGPELGPALGLLRSEELLAARRLDGARQFFTRAYDFGYSKSADEAFLHWPREALLADVVAVVRTFRPDAIVSIFSGTPSDGHGQHQAAGIMARLASEAAGNAERFPDQLERGLRPHSPTVLYQSLWRSDEGDVPVATGRFDPLLGRSAYQVAMASRSRHRSQDMGQDQPSGPHTTWLDRISPSAAGEAPEGPPAAGAIDPLANGTAMGLADRARALVGASSGSSAGTAVLDAVSAYDAEAAALRGGFNALAPGAMVPGLVRALGLLRRAGERLGALPQDVGQELRRHIVAEAADIATALARSGGLTLDAVAEDESVVPGQAFELELTLWNGGTRPVTIAALSPVLPAGWQAMPLDAETPSEPLAPGTLVTRRFRVQVPTDASPTEPYFLRRPRPGDLYVWPGWNGALGQAESARAAGPPAGRPGSSPPAAPAGVPEPAAGMAAGRSVQTTPAAVAASRNHASNGPVGRPFDDAQVGAIARVELAGASFELAREVTYRGVHPQRGEFRRPVYVAPRVAVTLEPGVAVLPSDAGSTAAAGVSPAATPAFASRDEGATRHDTAPAKAAIDAAPSPLPFTVRLTAEAAGGAEGALRLEVPEGWRAEPATVPVRLEQEGERRVFEFALHAPGTATPGEYRVQAVFETVARQRFGRGYALVDYPHIRARPIYHAATASVRALDVKLPPNLRVGYVVGVGDAGADAIRQLGLDVELLDAGALAAGDLGVYDVIVTGSRAYEIRPDLVAHNRRVLAYVQAGGTLIVQYNKYPFDEGDFAPYPLTMERPHDRVTDEAAPVTFVAPDHPVLTRPNRITAADFEGWIQDRGLYFAHTWDERYTPILAMADPGEAPLEGGLLIAPYGQGTYVYTGLAFFRQFPAGVPGAYRLFANLLSLGAR